MIGATLGATVCVTVSLFTVGLWPKTVFVVLFFILYQQVENYLLVPRVLRNTVDMPSVVVLLVALVGGALLGLAGTLMAIPIAATVKVAISSSPETGHRGVRVATARPDTPRRQPAGDRATGG
jgi:predicted PurR-regulated permease PerM